MNILYTDKYDNNKIIYIKNDIIFAVGGDGTLLKAIQKFKNLKLPFFGIAAGTENFLMNSSNIIDKNNCIVKEFQLIRAKITLENKHIFHYEAFNDIMIGGDMNSWINFNVIEDNGIIGEFKGGGLIVSTAQGTTGINKNNYGVILPLDSTDWSITGDKTNRKIKYVTKPENIIIKVKARTPVSVWVDGANQVLNDVEKVVLNEGEKVQIIFNDYNSFKKKRRI